MHDDTARKTEKNEFNKHIGGVGVDIQAFYYSTQNDAASRNKTEHKTMLSVRQITKGLYAGVKTESRLGATSTNQGWG